MEPTGKGLKKILVVGEAPGQTEDEYICPDTGQKGKQFIGKSGQYVRDVFEVCKIDMDKDCKITNALICRPPNNELPEKEKRKQEIISACRPNLLKTIKKYQPRVIILLGHIACKSLIPHIWKDSVGTLGRWIGWQIPSQTLNAWVCPTYHPSYVIRNSKDPITSLKFDQHIESFAKIKRKPWKGVPNWQEEIELIYRPGQAAKAIRKMTDMATKRKIPIAADYETTCLKPEYPGAEILCCSMSIGSWTIAYSWTGESIEASSDMWKSQAYKIAANLKFEDRWTRFFLGHNTRNWYFDTMNTAHVLDNRDNITSVKFQSFVLCGVKSYDDHIEEYRTTKGKKHLNRMKELDIKDMLNYCGMDSKVEWEVAKRQIVMLKRQRTNHDQ